MDIREDVLDTDTESDGDGDREAYLRPLKRLDERTGVAKDVLIWRDKGGLSGRESAISAATRASISRGFSMSLGLATGKDSEEIDDIRDNERKDYSGQIGYRKVVDKIRDIIQRLAPGRDRTE